MDHIKKVVTILDMGGEGFNKVLEVGVDVREPLEDIHKPGYPGYPIVCMMHLKKFHFKNTFPNLLSAKNQSTYFFNSSTTGLEHFSFVMLPVK